MAQFISIQTESAPSLNTRFIKSNTTENTTDHN